MTIRTHRCTMATAAALTVRLLVLGMGGCASTMPYAVPSAYTAVEARVDGSTLQIRYLCRDGVFYSDTTLPLALTSADTGGRESFALHVLTPESTSREPSHGRMTGRRIPLLDPSAYRRVRDAVIREIVPSDGASAVMVEMDGHRVALYFDDEGRFHSSLDEAPPGFRVAEVVQLQDLLTRAPGALERVLAEHGVGASDVLFNTGDTDAEALPFLYARRSEGAAAFVRTRPMGSAEDAGDREGASMAPSLAHTLESHTVGLLSRPATSLIRLLFIVSDAVQDSFDPVWTLGLDSAEISPLRDDPGMDLDAWDLDVSEMTGRPASSGTVTFLIDGEAFFTRLESAVDEASESVAIRLYIFDNDDYAQRFADQLKRRSGDGVNVRVLVDGQGTLAAATQAPAGLPSKYAPPASITDYLEECSDVTVRTAYNPFFAGDHTKTIVIDDEIVFIGGMNIGREYRYEWHDMMAEVKGPVVAELADDFDRAWAGAGFMGDLQEFLHSLGPSREPGPPLGPPVHVIYTRPTSSEIRNVQLAAIRRSRNHILVQNAYFTDDTFLRELVRARRRGVDVRVIVPLLSDRGILGRDNILAANALFENGVRVYIYPGMSHVKAAIYDGWACLGSANIDQLSLRINREANIATSDPETVRDLRESLFERDFRASPEMQKVFPTKWHDALWEMVGDYVF